MKYVCLVYCDEKLRSTLAFPEDGECLVYGEALKKSGHLIAAEPLQSVQTATTVRVQNGKITDHWGVGNLLSLMQQIGGWIPPVDS